MGYDVSQCQDPEQLFVTGEDGRRYFSATTHAIGIAMMIMGECQITEKNWIRIAANIAIINRVYTPRNSVSVVRMISEKVYEDIVIDWTHVKRHIGMRVASPKSDRSFLTRMRDEVEHEIAAAARLAEQTKNE
jgi:hypothetical protein